MMFRPFDVKPAASETLDVVAVGLDRRERCRTDRCVASVEVDRRIEPDRERGGVRRLALLGGDDRLEARVALAGDARLDELDVVEPAQDGLGLDGLVEHGLGGRAGRRDDD